MRKIVVLFQSTDLSRATKTDPQETREGRGRTKKKYNRGRGRGGGNTKIFHEAERKKKINEFQISSKKNQ
jgi:hypothetical protein